MVRIKTSCPHCLNIAKNAVLYITPAETIEPKENEAPKLFPETVRAYAVIKCCGCGEYFLKEIISPYHFYTRFKPMIDSDRVLEFEEDGVNIVLGIAYPEPKKPFIDNSFPKKINELMEELTKINKPEIVAVICRSILEYSLKDKGIGNQNDNLVNRINKAYELGYITKSLAEWSHIFRKIGNKAVHELEVSKEEAIQFTEFIKLFLELIYRIPAVVEKYHKK